MTDESAAKPGEDQGNPYTAPTAELGEPWGKGDPELEAIRRANLPEEAYLKMLVRANLGAAVLFGAAACYFLSFPIRHALGQIDAPWVYHPNWVVFFALLSAAPILSALGAYGLHRRKPWAIRVVSMLVFVYLIIWVFPLLNRATPAPVLHFVTGAVMALAVTIPFLNLWDLRHSAVLGRDYVRVMDATSYVRVKPKLPLSLRLIMIALALISLGLAYLSST